MLVAAVAALIVCADVSALTPAEAEARAALALSATRSPARAGGSKCGASCPCPKHFGACHCAPDKCPCCVAEKTAAPCVCGESCKCESGKCPACPTNKTVAAPSKPYDGTCACAAGAACFNPKCRANGGGGDCHCNTYRQGNAPPDWTPGSWVPPSTGDLYPRENKVLSGDGFVQSGAVRTASGRVIRPTAAGWVYADAAPGAQSAPVFGGCAGGNCPGRR